MAVNLARSFLWWHAGTDIQFHLITDQKNLVAADIANRVQIVEVETEQLGDGFSSKLYLDKLAPAGQTLFIDSDCLIYGNLNPVFEQFKGHDVSVVGNYISNGEWFGDVASICKKLKITRLPKFNGGVYYLEKGDIASRVYNDARRLEAEYDSIGFTRLRGLPNDEMLMAAAMELNHQTPIADNGNILAEFVNFQSGIKSNLLNGTVELYNNPADVRFQKSWHLTIARPLIVHYLGYYNLLMPYTKEVKQLEYLFVNKWPQNKVRLLTYIQVTLPFTIRMGIKKTLRPLYRLIFGIRQIEKSERVLQ